MPKAKAKRRSKAPSAKPAFALWTLVLLLIGGSLIGTGLWWFYVQHHITPQQLLNRLLGKSTAPTIVVTIPEGFNRFDIAERLQTLKVCDAQEFIRWTENKNLLKQLDIHAPHAEGYLFPDTYHLFQPTPARQVITRMVKHWQSQMLGLANVQPEGLATLHQELGWQLHEVLTLASIVEKEAALQREQATIAGVFLNRLRFDSFSPKRLQADPTVSYGCLQGPKVSTACENFDGQSISKAMLNDRANPYNTYVIEKLQPGPISNPGLSAIKAVLAPQQHRFLYFVACPGRMHVFSESLSQHNRAVSRCRSRMP